MEFTKTIKKSIKIPQKTKEFPNKGCVPKKSTILVGEKKTETYIAAKKINRGRVNGEMVKLTLLLINHLRVREIRAVRVMRVIKNILGVVWESVN